MNSVHSARTERTRHLRASAWLLAAGLLAASPAPSRAQASPEERLCLMDYARSRADMDKALDILRSCATKLPDSYQIQRTLGRKLLELSEEQGKAALAGEALGHLEKAAALDPAKFAEDWMYLAQLYESKGKVAEATAAYEKSLPYLTAGEKDKASDRLWVLYRQAGRDADALALWKEIWYRHSDDADSLVAAGHLHWDAGELDEARERFTRALEIDPENADAKESHAKLLTETAATGGSADKAALLALWLPKLGEADDALLSQLLTASRDILRMDAARQVAEEVLRRKPGDAEASLLLAEARFDEDSHAEAGRLARAALGGDLTPGQEARANAVLGKAIARQAYARYSKAGPRADRSLVDSTLQQYREARTRLRNAESGGLDLGDEIANIDRSIGALGGMSAGIGAAETAQREENCRQTGSQARLSYDRGKPMKAMTRKDVRLASAAGSAADRGTLAAGMQVSVRDASWEDGACWLRVQDEAGTSGWAKKSFFDGP